MVQAADGTLPIPGASAQSASGGALAQQARDTRSQIERLENAQVEGRQSQASQASENASAALTRASQEVANLQTQLAQATHDLEHAGDWAPGALFASKAKKEEKKKELQSKAETVKAALEAANAEQKAAQQRLSVAQAAEAEASGQVALLHSLRAKLQTQMDSLFANAAAARSEAERALAEAEAAARADAAQNKGWAAQYTAAENGLQRALGNLQGALKMLKTAQMVGRVEMVQDIGFRRREFGGPMRREGLLGEAVQMGNVRRANDMVAQAGAEILRVHEGLPTLPYVEPALVKSCTAGIFLDVLVGNLMSEMLIQQRIRANLGQVEKMAGQVQQCMQWTRANGQAFSQRSLQAEAAASGKAAELRALRLRLLDAL